MPADIVDFPSGLKGASLLKELMRARNLKQKDLAASIGRSDSYVSMIINGERPINAEVAKTLSDFFERDEPKDFETIEQSAIKSKESHTAPGRMIVGDELYSLIFEKKAVEYADSSILQHTFLELRLAEITLMIGRHTSPLDLTQRPASFDFGDSFQTKFLEKLHLSDNILAQLNPLPERLNEGFQCPSFILNSNSGKLPMITIQYFGKDPDITIPAKASFYSLTLTWC